MVAIKNKDADSFVARPAAAQPIVLLYGPDAGLVHERAQKIIGSSVDDVNDPFALVRLEGDTLASEPSRLVEEAHTVPLFGGKRAVWVKAGSRNFAAAVEAVVTTPPTDCRIVIEAGDLRRTAPLRSLCEKAKSAAAIGCYIDGEADLGRLVDDEMRQAKLAIAPDARAALVSLIGGDRQASRGEIRKLALYAHGKQRVEIDDVFAVVADASALALDAVVDSAFAGKTADLETQFAKALAAGTSPGTIVSTALRFVAQLHKARLALDAGDSTDEAMRAFIPPVHFTRRSAVEGALRNWTSPRLARAMEQLAETALNVRKTPALAEALAQRALLSIAMTARRKER
ncbi:DNA polymerase III subunit delta [Rhodoplanes sp. Z2-YC6860]|uniref:DNA polymerase III subunit delta n=1 Tax=Rhodoplanes sp. Z2-YC6860 TaxID=674703 RepID=UPI00078B5A2D|nr:DNA polymerase III subunit delta [Rhodoplanes sp. Z2-YC6860]AMN38698.1 DNA polymerase III subunit delta [Rhodoplanes sp. Z2-YC6860]